MTRKRWVLIQLIVLAGVLALFHIVDIDLWVQDHLYSFETHSWLVDRRAPTPRMLFYTGPKYALGAFAGACVVIFCLSFRSDKFRPYRRGCLLFALSLAAVPLAVAGLKRATNVYTPRQVRRYGGRAPYVKPLGRYPTGFHDKRRGRGYPAGHASGGFALMAGWFALHGRRGKRLALAAGLAAGWTMGIYQTVNGQHYLSHTVVTMCLAWLILTGLDSLVSRWLGPPGRGSIREWGSVRPAEKSLVESES